MTFVTKVPHRRRGGIAATAIAVCAVCAALAPPARAAATKQQTYATPEAAVEALVAALKSGDTKSVLAVLGADAKPILDSGDAVADRAARENFISLFDAAHSFDKTDDSKAILDVGTDKWPFPIPLVKTDGSWRFDTAAGKKEVLARRIGRNELATIQVCLAFVDAQREYFALSPQGDKLHYYAQLFISTKGKRDGLFWETTDTETPSPLGPLVARARGEGYRAGGKPIPYHGYYFRILKGQGPSAQGGAYDYVVRGKMIGGFALVAYPAEYGNSGIMTFMVNQDGVVFEKDLGRDTAARARAITKFDPDSSWTKVKSEEEAPSAAAAAS